MPIYVPIVMYGLRPYITIILIHTFLFYNYIIYRIVLHICIIRVNQVLSTTSSWDSWMYCPRVLLFYLNYIVYYNVYHD